jgi:hypothetical protein
MPDLWPEPFGFYNDREHGGSCAIVCVAAPLDRVSPAVAAREQYVVEADVYGRKPAGGVGLLAWQYADHPCSLFVTRTASPYLAELSAELGCVVAAYEYEKVSDWEQLRVYADGRCVESYAYGLDYSEEFEGLEEELGDDAPKREEPSDDGEPFDHRIVKGGNEYRFRSDRRKVPAKSVVKIDEMLDGIAKHYRLVFPEWERTPGEERGVIGGLKAKAFARVDVLRPATKDELPAGDAALREAIEKLDVEKVRAALRSRPDLKRIAGSKRTPVQLAMSRAKENPKSAAEIVALLASAGADVNAAGEAKDEVPFLMPFDSMVRQAPWAIPVLTALLDAGADVNARGRGIMLDGRTALHAVAPMGDLATIKFLHGRGADARAADKKGVTPRQVAQEAIATYEKGWPGAEESLPKLRAAIAYLERAERGEPADDDWPALAKQAMAEATRARREMKLRFADFGKQMKELGKLVKVATAKGPEKAAARLANREQPAEFTVRRSDRAAWDDRAVRDARIAELKAAGFEPVGTFTVKEYKGAKLYVLIDAARGTYAAIGEAMGQRWVDLVRYHANGTTLTVTNAQVLAAAEANRRGHRKVRDPKADVAKLVRTLDATRKPAGGVARITAEEFADRLATFLAEESTWRRKQ